MASVALLCPLDDFPYMLPTCFPVALLIVVTGLVPLLALLWRVTYYWRFERVSFVNAVRLRGRVAGVAAGLLDRQLGRSPPFLVRHASGPPVLVDPDGALVAGRRSTLRDGQKVTVLGVMAAVPCASEALFRQAAAQPGLQAMQIAPDRRRLVRSVMWVALLSWVIFGSCVIWSNAEAQRRQKALPTSVTVPRAAPLDRTSSEEATPEPRSDNKPKWPWLTKGRLRVLGPLDPERIRAVFRHHINQLNDCYKKWAEYGYGDEVALEFTVTQTGRPHSSRASTPIRWAGHEECLADAVLGWQFPRPGGGIVKVHYRFQVRLDWDRPSG